MTVASYFGPRKGHGLVSRSLPASRNVSVDFDVEKASSVAETRPARRIRASVLFGGYRLCGAGSEGSARCSCSEAFSWRCRVAVARVGTFADLVDAG